MWSVPLFDVNCDEQEIEAAVGVLRSGWLSMGDRVAEFERRFAAFIGVRHAVAVNSCTAALHLAALAVGVGPDAEVICPSLTFVAGPNSILYAGGRPVFADIESPLSPVISAQDVARRITPRTRAIQVMHYAGTPCDMDAILEVAGTAGLPVIEDCAHAPGALAGGRRCGALGTVGCFSFFPNKNMTTAEGGMVTTDDDALAEKIRLLRGHGLTAPTIQRHHGKSLGYDVVALGFNYRLDELRAAIGIAQLAKLEQANEARACIAGWYRRRLELLRGIDIVPGTAHPGSVNHILPVLLPEGCDRDAVRARLHGRGIQTSVHYPPAHLTAYYREALGTGPGLLPVTEAFAARALTLPLFPAMTEETVALVVRELASVLDDAVP